MRKALMVLCVGCAASAASGQVLVFDENSNNQYAQQGAALAGLGAVTVADTSNFNTLLASQTWQAVAVDCPSNFMSDNWAALASYITGGSTSVVMSFWDWNGGFGDRTAINAAFGITTTDTLSTFGRTLTADAGPLATQIFTGVTMPHSNWSDGWGDDGDAFGMVSGTPIAYFNGFANPVMFSGNGGRTIASFVIDEWAGDGAPVLWSNMLNAAVPAPTTPMAFALVAVVAGRRRR